MSKLLGLVVSVLVLLAACGGATPPTETPVATPPPGGKTGEVAVTARYASFTPATITVARGEPITLTVTSADFGHTFTIDELGINIPVAAGQVVPREIKVDRSGSYTFYCSVIGHRAAGMEGTLKAE